MALHEILVILFLSVALSDSRIVDTIYGPVNGTEITLDSGVEVLSFNGIPFAKPPVGDLRLAAPVEPDPWDEVYEAVELPNACPQSVVGLMWLTHPLWTRYDEDCLYLNIYTPNTDLTVLLPVMFWVHGGGFYAGANIQYPGHFLAAKDVVVVTVNYRLASLGFMTTEDDVAPGNYGLLDQIRGLEFVRDNIAAFGGDPDQVTIFGESAGGTSVGLLGLIPAAQGLFHQIITQSGSDQKNNAVTDPRAMPSNFTRQVADTLGCPIGDSAEMVDCLREQSAEDIRTAAYSCPTPYGCSFRPVVDGEVIPAHPREIRENDLYAKVPIMSGVTTEDGSLFTLGWSPNILFRGFNRSEFLDILWRQVDSNVSPIYPGREEAVFEAFNFVYTPWPHIEDRDANRAALVDIATDDSFGVGMERQITYHAQSSPVYQYIYGISNNSMINLLPDWMGVIHIAEIPPLFGYPYLSLNPDVLENSGITNFIPWSEQDKEWSDFIMTLWSNFAKTGNPTPEPVQAPGDNGLVTWDLRTPDEHNYLFIHQDYTEVRQDFRAHEYAFWTEYLPYLLGEKPPTIPTIMGEEMTSNSGLEFEEIMMSFLSDLLKMNPQI